MLLVSLLAVLVLDRAVLAVADPIMSSSKASSNGLTHFALSRTRLAVEQQAMSQLSQWSTARTEYSASVSIGTPPQNLRVLFDTGSLATWVFASRFNSSESSSFKLLDHQFPTIRYADNSFSSGPAVTESMGPDSVRVNNFEIMLADNVVGPEDSGNDGIVGMSLQNSDPTIGFMKAVMQQNAMSVFQVSFYIDRTEDSGTVTFGGYDKSLLSKDSTTNGDVTFAPVVDQSYHMTRKDGKIATFTDNGWFALGFLAIKVGELSDPIVFGKKKGIMVDTGTASTLLPQSVIDSIRNATGAVVDPASKMMRLPCDEVVKAPTLFFFFEKFTLPLLGEDYFIPDPNSDDGTSCVAWLGSYPDGTGDVLLGNTFLKRYLAVFDYSKRMVGFGLAKGRTPFKGPMPTLDISYFYSSGGVISHRQMPHFCSVVATVVAASALLSLLTST